MEVRLVVVVIGTQVLPYWLWLFGQNVVNGDKLIETYYKGVVCLFRDLIAASGSIFIGRLLMNDLNITNLRDMTMWTSNVPWHVRP